MTKAATKKPTKAQLMTASAADLEAALTAKKEEERTALQDAINTTARTLLDLIKKHEDTGVNPKIPGTLVSRFAYNGTPKVTKKIPEYKLTPSSNLALAILSTLQPRPVTSEQIRTQIEGFAPSSIDNEFSKLRRHGYILNADSLKRGGKYKLSEIGLEALKMQR